MIVTDDGLAGVLAGSVVLGAAKHTGMATVEGLVRQGKALDQIPRRTPSGAPDICEITSGARHAQGRPGGCLARA